MKLVSKEEAKNSNSTQPVDQSRQVTLVIYIYIYI